MYRKPKEKYYLVILLNENGTYNFQKRIPINLSKLENGKYTIRKNKIYLFDIEKPNYKEFEKRFYFVDYTTRLQLSFNKEKVDFNIEFIDDIVANSQVKQIIQATENDSILKYKWTIIGLCIIVGFLGGCIGWIVSLYSLGVL